MNLAIREYKEFQFGEKRVLLDIGRNRLYQIDGITSRILRALEEKSLDGEMLAQGGEDCSSQELQEALDELKEWGLVHSFFEPDGGITHPSESPSLPEVQTICMHLIHQCNLRCRYCYGKGGRYGSPGESMSDLTAVEAVEFLLGQIPSRSRGRILFFGGEPLLRWDLLQRIIPYVRKREREEEKRILLSLTTNGTLLNEEKIQFLRHHRVQINVSLDGPSEIHDRMRVYPDGSGSYKHILGNLNKLLRVQGICSLRATLNPSEPRLTEVVEHLLHLGSTFVHTEPASDLIGDGGMLSPQAIDRLKEGYRDLKERYIQAIQTESRLLPIFGFVRILRLLERAGELKVYGCGMGRSYVALSPQGEFYPCHRFVDQRDYLLGNLHQGLSREARERFVSLHVHQREGCRACWARYLCGGGCYYEAVLTHGDLEVPDLAHCELTQEIITDAIEIGTYLSQVRREELIEMVERLEETLI